MKELRSVRGGAGEGAAALRVGGWSSRENARSPFPRAPGLGSVLGELTRLVLEV